MSTDPQGRIYQLADCEQVLDAISRSHAEAILVGGQAVYLWATHYRSRCAELDKYLPYTSKDADYLADEPSAVRVAQSLGSQFERSPRKGGMMGLTLGHIALDKGMRVEILGHVYGVKDHLVRGTAVQLQWRDRNISVIHPLYLYIAKGSNVSDLDQSDRQDAKHFAIMELVVREFLVGWAGSEQAEDAEFLLQCCELLINFSIHRTGLNLIHKGHMPQAALWPDLADHPHSRVQKFLGERVPRWERQLTTLLEKARKLQQKAKPLGNS